MNSETQFLQCPGCRKPLDASAVNQPEFVPCPACGTRTKTLLFPAFARPIAGGQAPQLITADGESTCYQHSSSKAVAVCDRCGRFMCALCEISLPGGEMVCPGCIQSGIRKKALTTFETERTPRDKIALILCLLPVIVPCLYSISIVTAPISLFMAIRYWKTPLGILTKSKWRFVTTIVFSSMQIAAWIAYAVIMFVSIRRDFQ